MCATCAKFTFGSGCLVGIEVRRLADAVSPRRSVLPLIIIVRGAVGDASGRID